MTPFASAAYLVGVVVCITLAAAAVSRWAHADALDRALVTVLSGIVIPIGVALVLGMAGLLSPAPFLVTVVAIGVVSAVWLVRRESPHKRAPAAWSISGMVAVIVGAILGFLALVPTLAGRLSQHVETGNYHITNLVTWVRNHSIWELPFQNTGFFTATHPGNGELIGAPMLLATGGDQLAYIGNIVVAALCVIACATIVRELDGRPDLGALAALALVGAPLVFATQGHSLATDLPATAGVLAGVAALLRARRTRDVRWVVLAGFALGLALGSKYTVLLVVPVVVAAGVLALKPRRAALWLAPGLVLLAAPWFLRNLLATGNPIFPQAVRIGGIELFPGAQSPLLGLKTTMLDHMIAGNTGVLSLWGRVSAELFGPAALLVVVGITVAWFKTPHSRERIAVAAIGAVAAIVYLITPYTGGGPEGLPFLLGSNIRYTITAAFVGVALGALVMPPRLVVLVAAAAFGYEGWRMARGYGFRNDLNLGPALGAIVVVVLAGLACAALVALGRRRLAYGPITVATSGMASLVLVGVALGQINGAVVPARLEHVLSKTGRDNVMVLGVDDMRSVLGSGLRAGVQTVSAGGRAGERPPSSREELDAAVRSANADVIVVRDGTPGVPTGWTPPAGWQRTASTRTGDVYVREPETPPAPSTPPAPEEPQPSAPPEPTVPPAPVP